MANKPTDDDFLREWDATYLLDDDAWNHYEQYWREEVSRIEESFGQAGQWPSWEPKVYGDGITPLHRDGLAICDGRSERLDRAFAIQQTNVAYGTPSIVAWVNDWENDDQWIESESPRLPRARLFIGLTFSEVTADVARSLLTLWMTPGTTVAEMEAFIDKTPAGGPANDPGWPPYADGDSGNS